MPHTHIVPISKSCCNFNTNCFVHPPSPLTHICQLPIGNFVLLVDVSYFPFFLVHSVMNTLQVNGRIISKQIHVRVEHVSPSKCRDELKRRVKENEAAKAAAKKGGGKRHALQLILAARHKIHTFFTERNDGYGYAQVELFHGGIVKQYATPRRRSV